MLEFSDHVIGSLVACGIRSFFCLFSCHLKFVDDGLLPEISDWSFCFDVLTVEVMSRMFQVLIWLILCVMRFIFCRWRIVQLNYW